MTYRTLSDAVAIRDTSNRTLKFPRTMRSAGILGPLAPVADDSFARWACKVGAAVLAAGVVYGVLVLVLSLG